LPLRYFGMTKSLFKRIAGWLAINSDDLWLDVADSQAEIAPVLAEMESGLEQAKNAVASALVKEHRLERRLKETLAASAKWDARTDAYQQAAQAIQAALDRQRQIVAEMKASLDLLQTKVQDIRRQRDQAG
jgi:phage shock protein A